MTDDTTHTNEAARIAAALDNWDNTYGPNPDRVVRHFDGFTLTVAGLRTVLAALDNAQKHATRLDKFADDIATEQAELGADVQRLEAERDELQARVAELEREASWHLPEQINTATAAPHHVTLGPNGPTGIRHNLGCYQGTGRGRDSQRGDLICQFSAYLDQTDTDEHPAPGEYVVTVDVYGRSEEDVEASWSPVGSDRLAARVAELEAEREQTRAVARMLARHIGGVATRALAAHHLNLDPLPEWFYSADPDGTDTADGT